MKRGLPMVFALLLCLAASVALAQRGQIVQSVPQPISCAGVTICTDTPVPGSGGNHAHSGDEDGDGIPDGIDQCPNEGGPSSNQGCPVGRNLSPASTLEVVLMAQMPLFGPCVMATRTDERVNMHMTPFLSAPTVPFGWLDPSKLYTVDAEIKTSDGTLWYSHYYGSESSIPFGYALRSVVRTGGDCSHLPLIHWQDAGQSPLQVSYAGDTHIVLNPSGGSATEEANGNCAPSFDIDVLNSDGLDQPIHFSFGDGSAQPTPPQGCLTLNPDGHGFGIEPPPDPDNPERFPTPWDIGFVDNQLTLLTYLDPNGDGTIPPGPPDKPGVLLRWTFPPGQAPNGTLNFLLDFGVENPNTNHGVSPSDSENQTLTFSWGFAPCAQGDRTCHAQGAGAQGILINIAPADPNGGDSSAPNFMAYFFPNGFDPSVGGFTMIENQPGGSSPGDQYGFTMIENQPLTGEISIEMALPAAQ